MFRLGLVVATPGALALEVNLLSYLGRHLTGDWGDLEDEDKEANDHAVKRGGRIFSAYNTPNGRLWIITEADRSATTFLLPQEY